jgi:protein TonB
MRTWTLTVSVGAHACAIGAIIVAPLFATADLPTARRPPTYEGLIRIEVPTMPPPSTPKPVPRSTVTQSFPSEPVNLPDDNKPILDPAPNIDVPDTAGVPVGDFGTPAEIVAPPPVAAPPAEPVPVRVGGDIRPPTRITYVVPVYPKIALAAHVGGVVILEALIDERGRVRELRVLRGHPLLDAAATEAVSKWQFTPTLLNGTAVPVVMTVTVTFSLTK